ncbi:hypothetical protein EJB05_38557, partial [Eragrostis curvula]
NSSGIYSVSSLPTTTFLCTPETRTQKNIPWLPRASHQNHPTLPFTPAARTRLFSFRHAHAFARASISVSSVMMHRSHRQRRVFAAVLRVLVVVVGLVGFAPVAETAADTFVYAGCSPSRYQPGSPFEGNLKSLLTSISNAAPNAGYNSFTSGANNATGSGGSSTPAAYGLYQCRGDLDNGDCASCVRSCLAQLDQVCPAAYAASLQLEACYVRYDSSAFAGQLDTAMVYRKCSTSTGTDGGFLKGRDAVLADLQQAGSNNGYKVSSAGDVQGVAQCLGDLAAADCATCLGQAVGQLKGTCGTALAADVYLAQCYVRYWANGYYFRPTQDYSQDDVGKTIAIAIGICAGLALLVVFVSFLRKTC